MLPPTIPTSFVPHSAFSGVRRSGIDFSGVFGVFSFLALGIVLALAIGVFFYGSVLTAEESQKSDALAKAEATINPATVESFVRLRDRLVSGKKLLSEHIAFSGFFSSLGELVPTTVRFTSIQLSIDDTGTIKLGGSGVAKNFNALAAASVIFAKNERVKNAIFSNIMINNKDNSVSFALAATLDPKIISFSPSASAAVPAFTTSTSAATSTSRNSI